MRVITARSRTRQALLDLTARLREKQPSLVMSTGTQHALREFATQCYELGYEDARIRNADDTPIVPIKPCPP
jgi:hypothetical protein